MTQELPPTMAILVVDIEKFSRHTDVQRQNLATILPDVLAAGFARAGLSEVWAGRHFPDPTGDGYIIGFDQTRLPHVVDNLFDALQDELAERAVLLGRDDMRLRLRAGLTVGPVREMDDPRVHSPVDAAMIDNHRLVDADPVRDLLSRSDPEVTFVGAILSEEVVARTVSVGGYTRLRESQFVAVPVEITAKDFAATAYLRVPEPSGDLLAHGLAGRRPADVPASDGTTTTTSPPPPGSVHVGDVHGVSGVVGSVGGSGNSITTGDVTSRQSDD